MKNLSQLLIIVFITISMLVLSSCVPTPIDFAVKHILERPGEQKTEFVSYENEAGMDNSSGTAPLQVELQFERTYRHQIIIQLSNEGVSEKTVRDKIVEFYKLPVNDPEGETQIAQCPILVVIPAGQKAKISVEWTERWAEGVINEGVEGNGDRLGTYKVFLGYIEPCSLVNQENIS